MARCFLESAQGTRTTARGRAGIAVVRTRDGMKGRDIEGMSNGRWTRGFRGKDSDGMGFVAEEEAMENSSLLSFTSGRGEVYHVEIL